MLFGTFPRIVQGMSLSSSCCSKCWEFATTGFSVSYVDISPVHSFVCLLQSRVAGLEVNISL